MEEQRLSAATSGTQTAATAGMQSSATGGTQATPREQKLAEADRQRALQSLQMQRERILSERTSSPHRRSALEAALIEIEERLAELGWSIHL